MAHIKYLSIDIEYALAASLSVLEAAGKLGMSSGALTKRCKKDPVLNRFWEQARDRGLQKRKRWAHR